MIEAPISYRVNCHFPVFHSRDNIEMQSFSKSFELEDPFVNRENAFNFFYDSIDDLKSNNQVEFNKKTNEYEFSNSKLGAQISITLILSNEALETINEGRYDYFEESTEGVVYGLGQIKSYHPNVIPDDIFDWVNWEYSIYKDLNIETRKHEITFKYYGNDYVESGYTDFISQILKVNYKWDSHNYEEEDAIAEKEYELERKEELIDNRVFFNNLIKYGEGKQLEFKPFLVYNPKTGRSGITGKYHCAKTLASFLNTNGGVLIIGLSDDKQVHGIEEFDINVCCEGKLDKFKREFDEMVSHFLPKWVLGAITAKTLEITERKHVFMAIVKPAISPVYLEYVKSGIKYSEFFIRGQASSQKLNEFEIEEYLLNHYDKRQ